MDLEGKTALITGGAKRVGRGITLALARAGANVVINYNSSADSAAQTATPSPVEFLAFRAFVESGRDISARGFHQGVVRFHPSLNVALQGSLRGVQQSLTSSGQMTLNLRALAEITVREVDVVLQPAWMHLMTDLLDVEDPEKTEYRDEMIAIFGIPSSNPPAVDLQEVLFCFFNRRLQF